MISCSREWVWINCLVQSLYLTYYPRDRYQWQVSILANTEVVALSRPRCSNVCLSNYEQLETHGCIINTVDTDIEVIMMTSSNGNIFRVAGHLCGEFTGLRWIPAQRPVTQSFDVFFDLCLNKRLRKQSWGWWFETPSHPSWRQCNGHKQTKVYQCVLFRTHLC